MMAGTKGLALSVEEAILTVSCVLCVFSQHFNIRQEVVRN